MKRILYVLTLWVCVSSITFAQTSDVRFNRDIRPILSEYCYKCHGFDKNARKGNLRLDTEEGAKEKRNSTAPFVSKSLEHSVAWQRITAKDPALRMPPASMGKTMKPKELAILKRWIEQGAKWEGHWAYQAVVRVNPPQIGGAYAQWSKNSADRFVLATLFKEGLTPSPQADKATLLRRLSLDLTGLPPKPEDVLSFLTDKRPDAYERRVDTYLSTPHYGERMAQFWLDLVRYADTVGYHGDQDVSVHPYRDYVIDSFNTNKHFDAFTREQLAGDLIQNATQEQRVATAYNRLGMMSTEGGIQDKEYRAKYAVDRVKNLSITWLGSTLGCAECHSHKFDPFTQKDFYQTAAFFADLNEKGYYGGGYPNEEWGPSMRVPTPEQQTRLKQLDAEIKVQHEVINTLPDADYQRGAAHWEAQIRELDSAKSLDWKAIKPLSATSTGGSTMTVQPDNSVVAGGKFPAFDTYEVVLPADKPIITALRLEVIGDGSLPGNGVARAGYYAALSEFQVAVQVGNEPPKSAPFESVYVSREEEGYPAMAMIDGSPKTTWASVHGLAYTFAFRLKEPIQGGKDVRLIVRLVHGAMPHHEVGRFRVSLSSVPNADTNGNGIPDNVLALIRKTRSSEEQKVVLNYYKGVAGETAAIRRPLAELERDRQLLLGAIPRTLVSETTNTPRIVHILPRGNWMDDSGEVVQAAIPGFFKQPAKPNMTRLDLADWLTAKDNPLTARVFVNRMWKLYFGVGLSKSVEDFGGQGEPPLHPELLDWLATEFVRSGWDVKHIVKLIVTTATYRQSSVTRPDLLAKDPYNRYYARQSALRLDAEFIHDAALSAGGILVDKIGGASVYPTQPAGYLSSLNFPHREWADDAGEGLRRRRLYTHWQRTFLHPALAAFDAPSREEGTCARSTSNTPLQSLVLLNDPEFVDAARGLAALMISKEATFEARVNYGFLRVASRKASVKEIATLRTLFQQMRQYFQAKPAAVADMFSEESAKPTNAEELAAYIQIARVLLNLHETITRS